MIELEPQPPADGHSLDSYGHPYSRQELDGGRLVQYNYFNEDGKPVGGIVHPTEGVFSSKDIAELDEELGEV